MLLRRISEHVRNQNWFAVGLDFMIVVVGVFIGLQVSNWNEDRARDNRAEMLRERLIADISWEIRGATSMAAYFTRVGEEAQRAHDGLSGKADLTDEELLASLFRSTQYDWYTRKRATYDEIVSRGELDLIDDRQLRAAAVNLYNNQGVSKTRSDRDLSEFRRRFRALTPPRLHDGLREQCGDKRNVDIDGVTFFYTLDYDCSFSWQDPEELRLIAEALRKDKRLIEALRMQIAEIETRLIDINNDILEIGELPFMREG